MEKIVLIGAGGHAKTIVDTLERLGDYEIAGFIADGEVETEVYRGYKIIGHDEDALRIYKADVQRAFISIGYLGKSQLRNCLYDDYKKIGYSFPSVVDPSAIIANDVVIDEGTYIGRNAVVNADAKIGRNCIMNTAAIVEHECIIGDFSHVAVGAVICGQTTIGKNVLVGANATVLQGVTIGDGSIIGAGAIVRHNVPANAKIVGNNRLVE